MSRWPKTEKAIFAGEVAFLSMTLFTCLVGGYASVWPSDAIESLGYDFRSLTPVMLAIEGGGLLGIEYFKWYIKNH
jgi:hypothetical protein